MNKSTKCFYKIFHGNLAFSAIETEDLPEVIDKCYFPLLDFVFNENIKVGLELSGYSLEIIAKHRPLWIKKFKELYEKGLIELLGSGYMQIIGPIVPYEVNLKNQILGLKVYQEILDITPKIAYVNEQAVSKSMIDIYSEVGYQAVSMEWDNIHAVNYLWDEKYSYQPAILKGVKKNLPIIWNNTILFQQYQRLIHNESYEKEYFDKLEKYLDLDYKAISIYSSDLEIFNYRPGRFETEANIQVDEWGNIANLSKKIKTHGEFILPSEALKFLNKNNILDFTTEAHPIIVKKQRKYSLSRWAACGRGANFANTQCYKYFSQIKNSKNENDWKNLLHFWGSDYRTHCTEKKWKKFVVFFEKNIKHIEPKKDVTKSEKSYLREKNQFLIFSKDDIEIEFIKTKGLALSKVIKNGKTLDFGTINHGELEYISHAADYFTGTTVIENLERGKLTNLAKVEKYKFEQPEKNIFILETDIKFKEFGKEKKKWIIDLNKKTISLDISVSLKEQAKGTIRLGAFTLFPQNKSDNFWYECKNGGDEYERFSFVRNKEVEHPFALNILQSSRGGIGATNGIIRFGIDDKIIAELAIDQEVSYPFIMLQNSNDQDIYLTRLFFSSQELDDTLKPDNKNRIHRLKYSINI